jgi:hypothetical protein
MQPSLVPSTPRTQKVGYYLLGLAIGLTMVGLIVSARQRAMNAPDPNAPTGATPTSPATLPASPVPAP